MDDGIHPFHNLFQLIQIGDAGHENLFSLGGLQHGPVVEQAQIVAPLQALVQYPADLAGGSGDQNPLSLHPRDLLAQSMPRRWISLTSATSKSAALCPRDE